MPEGSKTVIGKKVQVLMTEGVNKNKKLIGGFSQNIKVERYVNPNTIIAV